MSGQRKLELIRRGFTLMELVVVIFVLAVLAAVSLPILHAGFDTYFAGRDIMEADSQARVAMERITRELRTIRSATATDLSTMTAAQISFNDSNGNAISYTKAGTTLNRNAQPLADDVSTLGFSYLQSDGQTTAATAATVYYITVSLTMSRGVSITTYRSTVKPWNF